MFYESREFPYGNKESVRKVNVTLNREDRRNLRKIDEIENGKGKLERGLEAARIATNITSAVTSIPVIISSSAIVAALVTSFGAIALLACNLGIEQTEETNQILYSIEEFVKDRSNNLSYWGPIFGRHLQPFLISIMSRGAVNKLLGNMKNRKEHQEDKIANKIIKNDDIKMIIEDITKNNQDLSLNFIREFLCNVDLADNSRDFNIQLLSILAEYRTSVLKEERNEGSKEETESKFINFIELLMQARFIDGASQNFVDSQYIRDLIKTYGDLVPINLEEKVKTKKFGCGKR